MERSIIVSIFALFETVHERSFLSSQNGLHGCYFRRWYCRWSCQWCCCWSGQVGLSTIPLHVKSKRTPGAKPVAVPLALSEYTLSSMVKMSNSTMITRRQLMRIVLVHSTEHWFSAGTASTAELQPKILTDLTFHNPSPACC